MAHLHIAQIAYLSQQLINQVRNANNLMTRSKYELDLALALQTMTALFNIYDELEKDRENGQH